MTFVWYILFIYVFFSVTAMISVSYYKSNRERKDKKLLVLANKWKDYIEALISDPSTDRLKMNERHIDKLQSDEELMAFFEASQDYLHSEHPEVRLKFRQFIRENKESWVTLGLTFPKRKLIMKAYFAYLCEKFCMNEPDEYDDMTKVMLDYVMLPSIYCRENALKALYAFGNKDAVIEAFKRLSKNNIIHNHKLVTDGLIQFKGNKEELVESLYRNFNKFSVEYQVAFIDFFRFSGSKLKYKLKRLLDQKDLDKDIVCALLRYYRKYPVAEYKNTILSWLTPPNSEDWECISSAASALSQYPGEDTITALKSALGSKYWYVRLNAARSISELDVEDDMLVDILDGNDRYAKEQLIYQLKYVKG